MAVDWIQPFYILANPLINQLQRRKRPFSSYVSNAYQVLCKLVHLDGFVELMPEMPSCPCPASYTKTL